MAHEAQRVEGGRGRGYRHGRVPHPGGYADLRRRRAAWYLVAVGRLPRTSPVCIGPHTPLRITQSRLYRAAYPPTYHAVPIV